MPPPAASRDASGRNTSTPSQGHAERTRRMPEEAATGGLALSYRYPSALDGDDLFRNRHEAVLRDIAYRDEHVDFDAARRLYDTTSTDTDDDGVPAVNEIRPIVEELQSVVRSGIPLVTNEVVASRSTYADAEVERHVVQEEQRYADASERYCKAVEALSEFEDARTLILTDACVVGVGYAKAVVDGMPSAVRHPAFAALLAKPEREWTKDDWLYVEMLTGMPSLVHASADGVFWQAGIASAHAPEMLRVTEVRRVSLPWARDHYEAPDLEAGTSQYRGVVGADKTAPDARADAQGGARGIARKTDDYETEASVGLAETWQLERFVAKRATQFRMGGGDAKDAARVLLFEDANLVRTVIGPNKLLEKQVLRPGEAPMRLPLVPYYVKASARHPYGFGIPAMLHLEQLLVNRMRSVGVRQAERAIAPGALVMLSKYLGASDDPETLKAKLAEGGVIQLEGDEDIEDVRKLFHSVPNTAQGIQPALLQMIGEARATMQRAGQSLDLSDLGRARSALAKQQQIAAADRGKTSSLDLLNRAEEDVRNLLCEHLRVHAGGEAVRILLWRAGSGQPTDGHGAATSPLGAGGFEAIDVNQTREVPVLDLDAQGMPMRLPDVFATPENPTGLVYRTAKIKVFDTSLDIRAVAEGRADLPVDKLARLNVLTAWSQMGLLKSIGAVRYLALPQHIAALDDAYAADEQQAAAAAAEQQAAAQSAAAQQASSMQAAGIDPTPAMNAASEAVAGGYGGAAGVGGAAGQPSALAQSVLGGMREGRAQAQPVG